MQHSRFLKINNWLERLVTPPCPGASLLVWLSFVAFLFFDRHSAMWHGDLNDPDDYLYLVQAIDWLNGQSWVDLLQHRMDPPQGTFIHYSHLLSGFYASIIALLRPFFDITTAALLTAAIVPLLYLAVFLYTLRKLAQLMIDPAWGDFTSLIILVSPIIVSQFWAGAIRHHGLEATLATIALYAVARMVKTPEKFIWAMIAGFVLALGLALGLEIIAVVGLLSLCIGVWAVIDKNEAIRSGVVFSLSLFVASFVFLLFTRGPDQLFDIIIPAYSIVYVILTGGIAFCFSSLLLISRKLSTASRCVIAGTVAFVTGWLFLHFFPALREGPYGGADPALTQMIFFAEPEAWPAIKADLPWGQRLLPALWPIIAIASNIFILVKTKYHDQRWLWGIVLVLLTSCTGLAEFYQTRFFDFVQPAAALPLTAMIRHDWEMIPSSKAQQISRIIRLFLVIVLGPATFLLASSHFNNITFTDHATSSVTGGEKGCDMHYLARLLNDEAGLGAHSQIIINTLNEGPELLFRTKDSVLAGPYHLNVQGNKDAFDFFTATTATEAQAIAQKRDASLIVICTMPAQLRAYQLDNIRQDNFIHQLMDGKIPAWLIPLTSSQLNDLMVFRIEKKD